MFPDGDNGFAGQDGDDDPLEFAYVVNHSAQNLPFLIVVDRFEGDPNKLLELNFNGYFAVNPTYNVAAGSIWGHAAAKGAFSIAATGAVVNLDDTPNPNLDIIEYYSSLGPSKIFFDKDSNPAPETRRKPDLTAVDGVSVTGAGGFPNPFYGTSAAAPHAAAVAALMKDVDPTLKPNTLGLLLVNTARERGTPSFDTTWGWGLIDAAAATRKAGQIGNSPLFWICLPGPHPVTFITPEILLPLALQLGAEFGKCDATPGS
jgi:subtilisin family serine protease